MTSGVGQRVFDAGEQDASGRKAARSWPTPAPCRRPTRSRRRSAAPRRSWRRPVGESPVPVSITPVTVALSVDRNPRLLASPLVAVAAPRQRRPRRGCRLRGPRRPRRRSRDGGAPGAGDALLAASPAGRLGLHQAKLRNASSASPTCSRTSPPLGPVGIAGRDGLDDARVVVGPWLRSAAALLVWAWVSGWRLDGATPQRMPATRDRCSLRAPSTSARWNARFGVEQRDVGGGAPVPFDRHPHPLQGDPGHRGWRRRGGRRRARVASLASYALSMSARERSGMWALCWSGSSSTRPSLASRRSASRSGVRLTPSSAA